MSETLGSDRKSVESRGRQQRVCGGCDHFAQSPNLKRATDQTALGRFGECFESLDHILGMRSIDPCWYEPSRFTPIGGRVRKGKEAKRRAGA